MKKDIKNQTDWNKDDDDDGKFWGVTSTAAFEAAHGYQASGFTGALWLTKLLQTQPDCNGESGQLQARIDVSMPQNMQVIHLRCVKQF